MTQSKPERGTKLTCKNCDARFYDLGRADPVCPKCGAKCAKAVRPANFYQSRKKRPLGKSLPNQPPEAVNGEGSAADEARLMDQENESDGLDKEATDEDASAENDLEE